MRGVSRRFSAVSLSLFILLCTSPLFASEGLVEPGRGLLPRLAAWLLRWLSSSEILSLPPG